MTATFTPQVLPYRGLALPIKEFFGIPRLQLTFDSVETVME